MMDHVVDIIGDRINCEPDGYTTQDETTMKKLEQMTKLMAYENAKVLVVDLNRTPHRDEAYEAIQDIVKLELANWVPGASQRLIRRASALLGFAVGPMPLADDHGPNPGDHALFPDWTGGQYVQKCAGCHRLFRA